MKKTIYGVCAVIGVYAFYGLLFFIPISISLTEVLSILMVVVFLCRKLINPNFRFVKFWPNVFLLLFLFFSTVSIFNSGIYLSKSANAFFCKWIQYFGIYLVVQDDIYDIKVVRRGVLLLLLSAFLVVISGLSQYFFGIEFLRGRSMGMSDVGLYAVTSSFARYNSFGAYLIMVILLAIVLLLWRDYFDFEVFGLTLFVMLSTAVIILTLSRGSWLSLITALLLVVILTRKNLHRLIPFFLVVMVMLMLPAFRERIILSFKGNWDSDRMRYWMATLHMIKEHPFFGMGLGTYMSNFSKYLQPSNISYAHNSYLQIWAETGIFSLLSFLAFTGSLIYAGVKRSFVSKDPLLIGLLCGAVGFLMHSFLDNNLYSLQLAILFWTIVGLIVSRSKADYS